MGEWQISTGVVRSYALNVGLLRHNDAHPAAIFVIASEVKQSLCHRGDCFGATPLAMTGGASRIKTHPTQIAPCLFGALTVFPLPRGEGLGEGVVHPHLYPPPSRGRED